MNIMTQKPELNGKNIGSSEIQVGENELQESNEQFHHELEVKIINLGDPQVFIKQILAKGGKLEKDRRLLHDRHFQKEKQLKVIGPEGVFNEAVSSVDSQLIEPFSININDFGDKENLIRVIRLLGLDIAEDKQNPSVLIVSQTPGQTIKNRVCRLRKEDGELTLTVKSKRRQSKVREVLPNKEDWQTAGEPAQVVSRENAPLFIDDRKEQEVKVINEQAVLKILDYLGFSQKSIREKYRTTYRLGSALVDLNEGPTAPPWAEIEDSDPDRIKETLILLGYKTEDTGAISDSEYYILNGVDPKRANNMLFEQ